MTERDSVLVCVMVTLPVSVSECVGDSRRVRVSDKSCDMVKVTETLEDSVAEAVSDVDEENDNVCSMVCDGESLTVSVCVRDQVRVTLAEADSDN